MAKCDIPYGKIPRKTWRAPRFKNLSDSEKIMLTYLWSSELGTQLQTLFYATIGQISDDLGWSPVKTRRVFEKLASDSWFVYDKNTSVVFFPKQPHFDQPANKDVIIGWFRKARNLPDTQLFNEFCDTLEPYCKKHGLDSKPYREMLHCGAHGEGHGVPDGGVPPEPDPEPIPEPEAEPEHKPENPPLPPPACAIAPEEEKMDPIGSFKAFITANGQGVLDEFNRQFRNTNVTWESVYLKMEGWVKGNPGHLEKHVGDPNKWWTFVIKFMVGEKEDWSRRGVGQRVR